MTGRAWPYLVHLLARGRLDAIALAFGGYVLRHRRFPPLRAGIRTRLRRLLGREEVEGYPKWIEPGFEREMHLRDRWLELQRPEEGTHPLHAAGHSSLNGAYWSSVFEREDAACTGAAVETRTPLLDQRVLRFLLRVPPVPWCMNKELLREAMRDLLPEVVRLRPKTPLQGDPLLLYAEKNKWKPTLADGACGRLRMFVDYRMFRATSQSSPGLPLWADIRPIALDYWLKSVEKNGRIQ
jgi:asparagine synthase (glutamine-hydrolysing)